MTPTRTCLFVRGFNTNMSPTSEDHYACINNFLISSDLRLAHFNYSPDEDLDKVYCRLSEIIDTQKYDIILGHSLGSGLLLKYFSDNPHNIAKYEKIVYLMPLLAKTQLNTILSMIPLIEYALLPKYLILPNRDLFDGGNILNDSFELIPIHQIVKFYRQYINTLNARLIDSQNSTLVYATDEKFNVIPQPVLNTINNKRFVSGKHECFNEMSHSTEFFKMLYEIL